MRSLFITVEPKIKRKCRGHVQLHLCGRQGFGCLERGTESRKRDGQRGKERAEKTERQRERERKSEKEKEEGQSSWPEAQVKRFMRSGSWLKG